MRVLAYTGCAGRRLAESEVAQLAGDLAGLAAPWPPGVEHLDLGVGELGGTTLTIEDCDIAELQLVRVSRCGPGIAGDRLVDFGGLVRDDEQAIGVTTARTANRTAAGT